MGDLSNAIALVGRVPFLSAVVAAIFSEMCDLAGKTSIASASKQQASNKQKHIAILKHKCEIRWLQRRQGAYGTKITVFAELLILCEA